MLELFKMIFPPLFDYRFLWGMGLFISAAIIVSCTTTEYGEWKRTQYMLCFEAGGEFKRNPLDTDTVRCMKDGKLIFIKTYRGINEDRTIHP